MNHLRTLADEILYGTVQGVADFLNQGADPNEIDEYELTPLIEAVLINNPEMCKILLQGGAQINLPDIVGRTPLFWAADSNNQDLCRLLLEQGADPNAYTISHQPILVNPLLRRFKEVKELLMQSGADLNFAQDFINFKLLGHRFELQGRGNIINHKNEMIEFEYDGFVLEFTVNLIRDSLYRFLHHFVARHWRSFQPTLRKLIRAYTIASELISYQHYIVDLDQLKDTINRYLTNEVLLLPVGYAGHAITFIKYGRLLARCDRGANSLREGSVVIYHIGRPQFATNEFFQRLLYQDQTPEYIEQGIIDELQLTQVETLPLSSQIIGNCSWANVEAAIPTILFMLTQTKSRAMTFYQEWQEWDKAIALTECMATFAEASPARKMSKASILSAIIFQRFDAENAKDWQRAKKIVSMLTHPDCAFVLKSYLDIYWEKYHTPEGRNLRKLLEMSDVL